jgi:Flp pilus assembly protein TadG
VSGLARDRDATTALEFAMVASVMVPLCLGALDGGLLLWTKGALQAAATATARCVALGSGSCSNAAQYAATLAGHWSFAGVISPADVAAPAMVCAGATQLVRITISSTHWTATMLPALSGGSTVTATAYFPTAAGC